MKDLLPVNVPLVNPNEPDAQIVEVSVSEGQPVAAGDTLVTLETTKSAAEVAAERDGYVVGLRVLAGQTVRAGDTLCYLADSLAVSLPALDDPAVIPGAVAAPEQQPPAGVRISQPALALARQGGLDLAALPQGTFITTEWVQAQLQAQQAAPGRLAAPTPAFDPSAVIIYGGGGHSKSLIDLLRLGGVYRIAGIVDDRLPVGTQVLGVPVLGGADVLPNLYADGVRQAVNAVGAIGDVLVRVRIFERLVEAGFTFPTVVHPTAFIEPSARLAPGVQVFPHAYIGSDVQVGFGAIINSGVIISHECRLGPYANLAPGAILAGGVEVGAAALVGMGASVYLLLKIGERARIANGAVVRADVPPGGIVRQ